jgi:hypothetical protein
MADGKVGLGAAAAALEAELRRFEQLAELATRVELKSQKNLERASRAAQDAAEVNSLLKQGGDVAAAEERLGTVSGVAEELLREAERVGFEDAARQAESIRQQSLAARNKLKLLREKKG